MKLTWFILAIMFAATHARAETLAEKELREIVTREKEIFARAQTEGEELDQARFHAEVQSLVTSYDVLIQKNRDFAPAYVAYGVMLSRVGMVREAAGILLKANKLDPNIALVKNQMAMLLAEDGKPLDALSWLMSAVDLEPREPLYHYHLGKLLTEGREDFIKSGNFTRVALDKAMLNAFQRAAELAPANWAFSYRAAEAYYDLEEPRWAEALAAWEQLEHRAGAGLERQTVQLQEANVLLKLGRREPARAKLDAVTDTHLAKQKQTLLDQLAQPGEK